MKSSQVAAVLFYFQKRVYWRREDEGTVNKVCLLLVKRIEHYKKVRALWQLCAFIFICAIAMDYILILSHMYAVAVALQFMYFFTSLDLLITCVCKEHKPLRNLIPVIMKFRGQSFCKWWHCLLTVNTLCSVPWNTNKRTYSQGFM